MSVTQVQTPEIAIDKIDVDPDFNSREHFDPHDLEALAETLRLVGLVQPVRVKQASGGRFVLVAGERRFRAAKLAGLKKVPIVLSQGNARAEAFFENHSRVDLNPIETALDIKALAGEHGLVTNAKIAAKINPKKQKATEKWVGDHLRLLQLPAEVQAYLAARDVPVAAEPKLRKVAEVSPGIAALICEVAKQSGVTASRFVERFADLLVQAGHADVKGKPTMIRVRQCRLSDIIGERTKKFAELAARLNALSDWEDPDPGIGFADVEIDAARAAGCLVEYRAEGNRLAHVAFFTDLPLAKDLAERAVDRRERERAARIEAQEAEKAKKKEGRAEYRRQQKEAGEESAQAKSKKRKAIARRWNDSLKRAILKRRTAARRKQCALVRCKAIVLQLVSDNPDLAPAGLRLVCDHLQDVEQKPLKNGGVKTTVIYASKEESRAELLRRVMAATDVLEVVEVGAEALLAGLLADSEEFPNKDYASWHSKVGPEIEKLLKAEIKELRPRKERKAP